MNFGPRKIKHIGSVRRGWTAALALLVLAVLPLVQADDEAGSPSVPVLESAVPTNVALGISVIRFRPSSSLSEAEMAASQGWPELLRRLTNHGKVEVIHRAVRELVCEPTAHLSFRQLESRPAFVLEAGKTAPQTNAYGLNLEADLRWLHSAAPDGGPVVLLQWSGSWRGSVRLYSKWEALAVRTFNAARTLPGITYERVEEDEDGFVNIGGTTDLGGLFRRKKNPAKPQAPAPSKRTKGAAKSGLAATAPGPSGEPEYFSDQVLETVPLDGNWLGAPGGVIVQRQALVTEPSAGDLVFVLTVERIR